MSIEKSLSQIPAGDGSDDPVEALGAIEIELEGESEHNELPDGSIEITFGEVAAPKSDDFYANLVGELDEDVLARISNDLLAEVEADVQARKEWVDMFVSGLDVLGFKYEERTQPWAGACGASSNLLAEAAIRFQAETMSETFPAVGPVKTKILGELTKEKEDAAVRVKADMNYQLTENMVEYRPEHERLLYALGLSGSAFKKIYFDPNLGRQTALFCPAEDVIVPYGASHVESAERVTHLMRKTKNEVRKLQHHGFYANIALPDPTAFMSDVDERKAEETGYSATDDDRYPIYEIHVDTYIKELDENYEPPAEEEQIDSPYQGDENQQKQEAANDEDGIACPYVITIEKTSGKVLAIRRNWLEEDKLKRKRQHFVHYVYVPGFGFYGMGLIHIVGSYARAGTSLIRQLIDAGTLANLPGGLKTRGLRVENDDEPIPPGEFKDVDVPSGNIRDNIMTLPYKEPSQTLLALLDKITTEGRRLAAISDMNISDMSANAPVGTTLALLERTLKPMAAVQARVHYAMKQEFKLLKKIMAEHAPLEYDYQPERGEVTAKHDDYKLVDVIPVSDPNSSTMAQRVVQHQAALQMAQQAPHIYDEQQLHRQMLDVLGIKHADKIIPTKEDAVPVDPVSENMNVLIGKPVHAFIYQDHDAHIAAHMAFMQDPMVAQTMGQNPQAKQIMAALHAHIAEHLGFTYRKQIEERLGAPLPPPNEQLPEEIEVNLARLVADAGKQLAQAHQQQAAQQKAQQQAEDPIYKLQVMEQETKAKEVERKSAKDQRDFELQKAELMRKAVKDKADTALSLEQLQLEKDELLVSVREKGLKLDNEMANNDIQLRLDILDKAIAMKKEQMNNGRQPARTPAASS